MFLFSPIVHVFLIDQKLQNPNLQCHCGHRGNSECEIVFEELSGYPFQRSMFTFIIIKPITKFGFCFVNVRNFTANSTFSQFKGPLWVLKVSWQGSVLVAVNIESHTKQVLFPRDSHFPLLLRMGNVALIK